MSSLLETLPKWFQATAAGKAACQEEEKKIEARRRQLAADLAELAKERDRVLPGLAKARDKAERECQLAYEKWLGARTVYDEAKRQCGGQTASLDAREAAMRKELTDTAPPEIDKALQDLERMLSEARGPSAIQTEEKRTWNPVSGTHESEFHGNSRALKRTIAALVQASKEVRALKAEYVPRAELAKRLAQIMESIPPYLDVWD